MFMRLLVGLTLGLVSVSCAAQVAPASGTTHPPLSGSVGFGMDYMSGDWGRAHINRWGPTGFVSATIWHDVSVIAEGRSVIWGGNDIAQNFKYVEGGGGLVWVSDYFGRFQPLFKGEIGFGSLSHPDNGTGHFHDTRTTYTFGGGVEYHTAGRFWTRVEYDYDFFPDFHSTISGKNHPLNTRGFTFGETYRFGRSGSRY
jgi:opacity protein-like surface antigen